jgi:hypothetical protein
MGRILFFVIAAVWSLIMFVPFTPAQQAEGGVEVQTISAPAEGVSARARFFLAMRIKESNDDPNVVDGDHGKAIGVYQIWRIYYRDAVNGDASLLAGEKAGRISYETCRDPDLAHMFVGSYMRRYESRAWENGNWERLARLHNGGPAWERTETEEDRLRNARTLAYWRDVKRIMKSLQ